MTALTEIIVKGCFRVVLGLLTFGKPDGYLTFNFTKSVRLQIEMPSGPDSGL